MMTNKTPRPAPLRRLLFLLGLLPLLLAAIAGGLLLTPAPATGQATPVVSARSLVGEFNAKDFGAKGDDGLDDTAAIQRALDAAEAATAGYRLYSRVFLPPGNYVVQGAFAVPINVTLEGAYTGVPNHATINNGGTYPPQGGYDLSPSGGPGGGPVGGGTNILIRGGANAVDSATSATITLRTNAVLRGVSIVYPDQLISQATPTPYRWAVRMTGNSPTVENVELLNPYRGIWLNRVTRGYVNRVSGSPIALGLYASGGLDVNRLHNIHWNPYNNHPSPQSLWRIANGRGFVFGREDLVQGFGLFCILYRTGFHFIAVPADNNGQSVLDCTWGEFYASSADVCYNPIRVDRVQGEATQFFGGTFTTSAEAGEGRKILVVSPSNDGAICFRGSFFYDDNRGEFAQIDGSGAVTLDGVVMANGLPGSIPANGRTMVTAQGTGRVHITGCEIRPLSGTQIALGGSLSRAVVQGNLMGGPLAITNAMGGGYAITGNAGSDTAITQ